MSVRLLRKSSDTPNITNRDDANMIRYAYGGSDGVVKNFGSELSYSTLTSRFIINSGKVVVQGWEVNVDSWELNLSTVTGTQYHLVYLEVNIASEIASIKSTYLTDSVPSIDPGDDLTQYPNGTARIPLYSFKISSKTISSVEKKFSVLEYESTNLSQINTNITSLKSRMGIAEENIDSLEENVDSLEERLSKLGFKQGSVTIPSSTSEKVVVLSSDSILKRQGNYVIGKLFLEIENGSSIGNPELDDIENALGSLGIIPKNFLPAQDTQIHIILSGTALFGVDTQLIPAFCSARCLGSISASTGKISTTDTPQIYSYYFFPRYVEITFGYEAAPLT